MKMITDTTKEIVKGGGFLVKQTDCNDVFTPEDFSEEQLMMKSAVKEFVDREIWPHKERFENKDYEFTKEIMEKAGELGFLGVSVPEEYGGLGMDFVLNEEMFIIGTRSPLLSFGIWMLAPVLLEYGTEEQKQKYIPRLSYRRLVWLILFN